MPCWSAVNWHRKARTAVAMKTATHKLADTVQPGAPLYGLESHMQGKVVTFGGGFPSGVTEYCSGAWHQRW